ncbi:glycosyltransferase family protein [Bosea sp. (in: a-proteobacteria)]|uniref:glycosyltransferase family protein n=1 Tax=Bosea sp. (in: a-proteobacteria) TaxID=1871050 RepID=UPI002FC7AA73
MSRRVLIGVTHLLGIGHLVRARHLARALAQAGYEVTLASGGMPDGKAQSGYRLVQLPPVRAEGTDFRNLLDAAGAAVTPERLAARREGLAALASEIRPDIVITEHFPFGRRQLAAEFLALIEAARAADPRALVLASIRDVLVAPQRAERLAETAQRVAGLFDGVLVHGDRNFLPLEASWPVTPAIATKLIYTGYLAQPSSRAQRSDPGISAPDAPGLLRCARNGGEGEILVSGGGSAAALPLFEAALAAAHLLPHRRFHLLVGQGVTEARFESLRRTASGNARVERARPDFPALLHACALSISQAGYNTVLDLVQARRPALLVPFDEGNETEQALRAAALERAGLARISPRGAGPQALATIIEAGLAQAQPAPLAVDLDGAAGVVSAVARLLTGRA